MGGIARRTQRNWKAWTNSKQRAAGFSLIEAMVALAILSFGVLSLAAVYAQGLVFMSTAQYDFVAQNKAAAAIETIFTARDTKLLNWAQIRNGDGTPGNGVFLSGPQPLLDAGRDGLVGTIDDDALIPDTIVIGPGTDGVLGTADDQVIVLNMFTREIQIRDIAPNLREVTVTIRYRVSGIQREWSLVSYISSFA
jgi:prepilin-type N-terminal cleavage/methylation domain-containing protein